MQKPTAKKHIGKHQQEMEAKHEEEEKPQKSTRKWSNMDKLVGLIYLSMHGMCILAPFYFNWGAFWVAFALAVITGFGITLSYHRNLSHRSFKLPKWLEYSFAYCGVHALQGDPIDWVSTHRSHHRYADSERDPHSPIEGFWFSYITWTMDSYALTKKVNLQYDEDIDEQKTNIFMLHLKHGSPKNVDDLVKQRFYQFIRKTYLLHPIALAIILYLVGGLPYLIWGMAVRNMVSHHFTFMANSICHSWGRQPWNTDDLSKNNWLMGLLVLGDGWHNNHHAFEYSAKHGLEWWQLDFTWYLIQFLQALGLATDVKLPSQKHMLKLAKNKPSQ